eukprot:scaffold3067_cov259-Alexandrium_tamarense.AAC.7
MNQADVVGRNVYFSIGTSADPSFLFFCWLSCSSVGVCSSVVDSSNIPQFGGIGKKSEGALAVIKRKPESGCGCDERK